MVEKADPGEDAVARAREKAQHRADENRERARNEYAAKGLGRSTALLQALLEIDVEAVESILAARLQAEVAVIPAASAESAAEVAVVDIRGLVHTEMNWVEARALHEAGLAGLPGWPAERVRSERDRLSRLYERELRSQATRRQLATENLPYFPDVGIRFHVTGRVHMLEAVDVMTPDGIHAVGELLYEHPEHDVYLFFRQNEAEPPSFTAAREDGVIVVAQTEDHYYHHPRFQRDYVSILPGRAHYDWERELVASGPEYRRLTLRLSERERVRWAIAEAAHLPDTSGPMRALWILESPPSDDDTITQGTAFALAGVGLVTCAHVLVPGMTAYQATDFRKREYRTLARDDVVDLAVLEVEGAIPYALEAAQQPARTGDPIAIFGFPNYRLGDTGVVHTGRVSGRRPVSGIQRFLLSAAVVRGMSGGPVLNARGRVVGVAVTGADRLDQARETEDQSAIPLEALVRLQK